jgi:HK97 family phage major capsid protein
MTEKNVVEVTKDDLTREIESVVKSTLGPRQDRIEALLTELIGKDNVEKGNEDAAKMAEQLKGLTGENRAARLELMRNRALEIKPGELAPELKSMGWGKGELFASYSLLMSRCAKEFGKQQAAEQAEKVARASGNIRMANLIAETRTLQAGDLAGAGALIPEAFSTDFIEVLRSATVVRRAGASTVQMPTGGLDIGRQNATSTAHWIGEQGPITASEPTYGRLKLSAKKLAVKVPVSNDAIRRANGVTNPLVTGDMVAVAANAEDIAFIRGSGTANIPAGMRTLAATGQFVAMATPGTPYEDLVTDLVGMLGRVYGGDVMRNRPAYIFSSSDYYGILGILLAEGAEGNWLLNQFTNGNLMGVPVYDTSAIPITLGGGAASEAYLAEMSQCVIGDTLNLLIEEFNGGAYNNGSGLVSGVDTDETVLRLIHEVDFVLRHTNAVAGINNANYAGRT